MTEAKTKIATCHCGEVVLRVTLVDGFNDAWRCDCSYCRRRSVPTVTAPLDGIEVLRGQDKLRLYQWGTMTAKHYFCSTCGIYMYHKRRSDPNQFGVNLYAFDEADPKDFEPIGFNDGVNHPSDI
ncbi:GFA family protein [Thalassococcus lentus]|uniref:GFA family protein n=1 Tax=Thalassococcus lentus TaxID=1210524 RepID=A0ABT4XWL7_9RHOB|nr:GFA family protein [Thalassococcus lentus]MDA7426360.1 GFA family protein [Thalassococcus lentus]